ncbi:sigma-70 family RNA polymerase sigma factor [Bacillus salitolerans]|uniref:Sigma-70 family RNA polymerase sigma factor n=1 Tax=Bacillus salitolerans TaxID=1437434 RepID=A0ABW4LUC3_9BACI
MFYEVKGSFKYPDLPTEKLIDVSLYYSRKILIPYEISKERPVFIASELEDLAIQIMKELKEVEVELKKKNTKMKMDHFVLLNEKYSDYLESSNNHKNNRIFSSFLDDIHNQFLLILSLFSYKNYPFVLDDVFRKHFFEYRFISYLTTYFYYESVQFDKKVRKRNEKECAILDSPIDDGITLKDSIATKGEVTSKKETFKETVTNDLLVESFKALSALQQDILNFYYVEGYKEREISEMLNISQQAVSKSKRKAIDKLKKLMKGGCGYGRG